LRQQRKHGLGVTASVPRKFGLNDSFARLRWSAVLGGPSAREISDSPAFIDQDIEPLKFAADEAGCFLNGFPSGEGQAQ